MVPVTPLLERTLQSVKEDPKKALVLAVLVAVMGGLWARAVSGQAPATVTAAIAAAPSSAAPEKAAGPSAQEDARAAELHRFVEGGLKPVGRNLFRVTYDYFPRQPGAEGEKGADLAKSASPEVDVNRERKILAANLQREAARLRLQSTMMGKKPKAMVNGELVEEGDVVASFRVLKVEARGIIIEREGIRLEVLMK